MSRDRTWVASLISQIVKGTESERAQTAEMIVDRLMEEGILHLGYGNADIDKVVEAFKEFFGTTKVTQQDRFAARRLVEKYGSQSIVGIVRLLAQHASERYAPVVNSVSQLESKFPSVVNFLRKQSTDNETIQTP
jgi:hypothetical protein